MMNSKQFENQFDFFKKSPETKKTSIKMWGKRALIISTAFIILNNFSLFSITSKNDIDSKILSSIYLSEIVTSEQKQVFEKNDTEISILMLQEQLRKEMNIKQDMRQIQFNQDRLSSYMLNDLYQHQDIKSIIELFKKSNQNDVVNLNTRILIAQKIQQEINSFYQKNLMVLEKENNKAWLPFIKSKNTQEYKKHIKLILSEKYGYDLLYIQTKLNLWEKYSANKFRELNDPRLNIDEKELKKTYEEEIEKLKNDKVSKFDEFF